MLGLVQPCRHSLPGDLFTQWQAHLCGLCLSLRDGHGQAARLTTNTDAVMISILTAAQRPQPETIAGAGACPLRGMRSAVVVGATDPGLTLAAAASLTLAAAKAGDVVAEQRHGLARPSRLKAAVARGAARRLERHARTEDSPLDVDALLTTLSDQAALESSGVAPAGSKTATAGSRMATAGSRVATAGSGPTLTELTEPTARACAQVFAATADSAGNPANREPLAEIGYHYGRLAHLLDAVEDIGRDARTGDFNPLTATGTTTAEALADCRRLADAIGGRYRQLRLHNDRLLRVVLLDGIRKAIHRRDGAGHHASSASPHEPHQSSRAERTSSSFLDACCLAACCNGC